MSVNVVSHFGYTCASICETHFLILLGDFHAKFKLWSAKKSTRQEGAILKNLISLYKPEQLISTLVYILKHSSSYIDLIFVNQLSLVTGYDIHMSLHKSCHYQVILCKLNLSHLIIVQSEDMGKFRQILMNKYNICKAWNYGKS